VSVEDDGVGMGERAEGQLANGLCNQAARMKDIGGTVEIRGLGGQGTQVVFQVRLAARS